MKKTLFLIILLFAFFLCKAQYTVPRGNPQQNGFYYNFYGSANGGFVLLDSLLMFRNSDTAMKPLFPGIKFYNNVPYYWDMSKWNAFGSGGGGSQSWDDVMTVSPDINSSYTSDFNGNDWILTNLDNFIAATSTGFVELSAGAGTILDLNPGGTFALQSSTGTYQYSNLNTITNISTIATWSGSNLSRSTFSSVADSLAPYLPSSVSSFTWSVIDSLNTPPGSPTTGDIYEVGTVPTGVYVGHVGDIAEWDGATWVFSDPAQGDLLYNNATDFVSRWTGSVWVRISKATIHQGGDAFGVNNMRIGTNNNKALQFETNNVLRFTIGQTGSYTFSTLTGSDTAIMGLTAAGVALRFDVDSFKATIGGAQGLQNVITTDPVLTSNNTITGAGLSLSFDPFARITLNVSDSIRFAATNDIGINAVGTARVLAATIYNKAALAQFGSNSKTIMHYETGVGDSVAIELKGDGMRFVNTPTGSTGSILRRDANGFIGTSTTINAATELTGIVPVENGGTEVSSLTAYGLIFGGTTTTGPVQTLTNGTSGYYLKSNGASALPSWETTAGLSPWTRGTYDALASLNIVQTVVHADTVVVGASLASILGLFNVSGRSYFTGNVGIGTAPNSATYELNVGGDFKASGDAEIDGKASINTFSAPVAGNALIIGQAGNGVGILIGVNQVSTNSAIHGIKILETINQTSAAVGTGFTAVTIETGQSNTGTPLSGYIIGVNNKFLINSTNATEIPLNIGYKNSLEVSLGTQKVTTSYGFRDFGIVVSSGSAQMVSGNYTSFRADSMWQTRVGGSIYGFYSQDNAGKTIINTFEPKSGFGTTTSPTAWAMFGAGTTGVASTRYLPGVAPSSPNDGDRWYEDTNDRMMFRQNATSVEIIGVSAVSSVSPTAQNRTLTIIYNGTTYYLTAKTTND